MAGTNNRGALVEDWMLPSPSPRTLMSSFWNEEFSSGSFPNIFGDDSSNKPQDGIDKSQTSFDSSGEEAVQETKTSLQFESNPFDSNEESTSNGGLAERMAARAGFGVLKIDTSRVSSSAPIRSPVTIPPGVSPRELLESPVFLPNAIAQPSPTTGKLPFLMPHNCKSTTPSVLKKAEDCSHDNSVFSFQPILSSKPPNFLTAGKGASVVHQNKSLANDNQKESSLQSNSSGTKDVTDTNVVKPKTCDSMLDNDHPSPADEQEESEENQNGEYSSALVATPDEDGYNWRKYGQKQVKHSEHPRSYYKCTHPDCPVKKKVERSQDGHITEIVYKGSHSHPLPPPNRRPSVPLSHFSDLQVDGQENFGSKSGHNTATSQGSTPNGHLHDVHSVLETKLSNSLITTEIADKTVMECPEAVDISSTISSSDKDEKATHGSIPSTFNGDNDETESKRRKMDVSATTNTTTSTFDVAAMASRAVREPRIIVQTTSEVDILDDGYRWRKYGQKVVKGNPNPRSYYKCTHAGCGVRKHVERASNDLKSVITTYEGKHNHEVPAARNSSGHPSSSAVSNLHQRPQPAQASIAQFSSIGAYGSLCLPPQLRASSGGFCFGMLPPGMAVQVPSPGTAVPMQIPGHPPAMQHYPGLMLPRGEMKVNPEEQSSLPLSTRSALATYQQLMGRLPQGPQM